jgi:hypothetical protein
MLPLYRDTFANNKLDAIAFPTTPKVAIPSNPDSTSDETCNYNYNVRRPLSCAWLLDTGPKQKRIHGRS